MQAASVKGQPGSGEWTDEEVKKFKTAWEGKGVPNAKDNAVKTELVTMIRGLSGNKDLEDTYVKEHKDVKDYMDKSGLRICFSCFSPNCMEKSIVAKRIGLNFNPRTDCMRKSGWLKFSGVKDNLKLPSEISRRPPPKKPKVATKHTAVTVNAQPTSIVMD